MSIDKTLVAYVFDPLVDLMREFWRTVRNVPINKMKKVKSFN